MPITPQQAHARALTGVPFLLATYAGFNITEIQCKVAGNANMRETRAIIKHTLITPAGVCVHTEFLPVGTVTERNKEAVIVKAILPDRTERSQTHKLGSEVVVTLREFRRDGVGNAISGELQVVA